MKKTKRLICVVLVLILTMAVTDITAFAASSDFTIVNGVLTAYHGSGGDVVIPSNLGITSIGERAFDSSEHGGNKSGAIITSITIPDGVTTIGGGAFSYCAALSSITIPDSVTSIGGGAFAFCESLTSVTIPDSVTEIGEGAFSYCYNMESMYIPGSVTTIGAHAFEQSGICAVTLGRGILSIGDDAFHMCAHLESVIIPDTVTQIGAGAFLDCSNLKSVMIARGVTSIGFDAFGLCKSLESVIIPDTVTEIQGYGFADCNNLKSVIIPDSVTSIGDSAFVDTAVDLTIYGVSGSFAETYAANNGFAFAEGSSPAAAAAAEPTASTVTLNGDKVSSEAYNIDGSNYFKLRDLACALSGTEAQFEVGWDSASKAVSITSGKPYTSVGGELENSGSIEIVMATLSNSVVYLDGTKVSLTAYTINGNNYFKLRDLAAALNFGVTWDSATSTIGIDTSTGYTAG